MVYPGKDSEGFFAMGLRIETSIGREDPTVRPDDIGHSFRETVDGYRPVGRGDGPGRIRDQIEREGIAIPEFPVRGFVLHADAEDDRAGVTEGLRVIPECAGLPSASQRVVLRIEVEHDAPTPEIPKPDVGPILIRPLELRSQGAGFEQVGHGHARFVRTI